MGKISIILFFFIIIFSGCDTPPSPLAGQRTVEVVYKDGRAQLLRHGKPYFIKGGSGFEQMEKLANYGGNSIRTWNTDDALKILDEAEKYDLTVTLGLKVGKQWWGDDFNYWNFKAVDEKIEELRTIIRKYKDHPSLLMWGIGNEVHLFGGNKYIIYYTLNNIAKMIHEEDPNHPTMTAIHLPKEPSKFLSPKYFMSEVDIIGLNAFDRLPNMYDKIYGITGYNKPYILSEWGPTGHWEITNTEWGAPKELNSHEKSRLVDNYFNIIKNDSILFLGGYAFYWGHKHEITHTWFSLFSEEGYETEAVNVLNTSWTGNIPSNHAPLIVKLEIETPSYRDNFYLIADSVYKAAVYAYDADEDSLTYKWELRHEEANFYDSKKSRYNLAHLLSSFDKDSTEFKAPQEVGGYRLFIFVYDGKNHVATHNIPFYVVLK